MFKQKWKLLLLRFCYLFALLRFWAAWVSANLWANHRMAWVVLWKLPSLTIHETLWQSLSQWQRRLTSRTKTPSLQVTPVIWQVPLLTPCTPSSQSDQVPLLVWPQSQTPCSIKQFINRVITQKQPGLVHPRRDLRQRNSWVFILSQSKASLILLPESSLLSLPFLPCSCIHSPG